MKYLGIDYGTKKVGLAISDDTGSVAFPRTVIPNDTYLFEKIEELLENEDIHQVVIGHSLMLSGKENPLMEHIHAFKEVLTHAGFAVHLEPEFWTTAQAKRNTKDSMADASAAALILQSFLDKK